MEENKVLFKIAKDSVGTACEVHFDNIDDQFDTMMALCSFFERNQGIFMAFLKLYETRQGDSELREEIERNTFEISNYDFNQLLK